MNTIQKIVTTIILSVTITMSMTVFTSDIIPVEPSYAKWGTIAVKETNKKYNAAVVDYLHIGSKKISDNTTEEKFKLIINRNNKDIGVIVTILYNTNNNQLLTIHFQETNP
ncbi:DUF3889 domain-containing protein [Paenibacillus sp. FA6]|uniref:DUF3889 domain-containing protein n=1 Tax=Paenibacillus sp. FA6 TaxID=3413029 RepID=UPI003F65DF40